VTAFDIIYALMLSTCSTEGSVMTAKQSPGCTPDLGDCAKELFKPLNDVASFLDCIEKKWKALDSIFLWVMS